MFPRDFTQAKKRCVVSASRWSPNSSDHSHVSLTDVALPEDSWPIATRDDTLHTPPAIPFISKTSDHSAPSRWTYRSEDDATRRSPIYMQPEDNRRCDTSSPPPLPPRRSAATQTACSIPSNVTTKATPAGLWTENSRFTSCRQTIFDDTDVVISTSADYAICSNGDSAISRVVRISGDFEIAALSGLFVPTQILYPTLSTRCECCTTQSNNSDDVYQCMCRTERVYSCISMLDNDHWLAKISHDVLRVKEGVVSRYFAGRLSLCLFNNTHHSVKVLSGSPIALHITRVVPYCN